MFQNYFKHLLSDDNTNKKIRHHKWWIGLFFSVWVLTGYYLSQLIMVIFILFLKFVGFSEDSLNEDIFVFVINVSLYILTIIVVTFIPWLVVKSKTTKLDIGLTRLPFWGDIIIAPAGMIFYFILSAALLVVVSQIFPQFDIKQIQVTGFEHLSSQYQYILAFILLVVVAPISEEILFRGYLFGKLKKFVPVWVAILFTSILFGVAHGAWNLAIDTFALSIILCLLRESSGSIWASILLHMIKNGIAFYLLFISPLILATLVG